MHSPITTTLEGTTVIDVRLPEEFNTGHFPNAINIPVSELTHRLDELRDVAKPIVICCASGARSRLATRTLRQAGIECEDGGSWLNLKSHSEVEA